MVLTAVNCRFKEFVGIVKDTKQSTKDSLQALCSL